MIDGVNPSPLDDVSSTIYPLTASFPLGIAAPPYVSDPKGEAIQGRVFTILYRSHVHSSALSSHTHQHNSIMSTSAEREEQNIPLTQMEAEEGTHVTESKYVYWSR